jgi:hypothetical protein
MIQKSALYPMYSNVYRGSFFRKAGEALGVLALGCAYIIPSNLINDIDIGPKKPLEIICKTKLLF